MKAIVRSMGVAAALGLLALPALAADGVVIVQKTTVGGNPPQTNRVQIEGHRMRAEVAGASGAQQIIIFDGGKGVFEIVDLAGKTYTEMTKADVEQLGGQMSAAMAQMQAQMKSLPPEQRERIEAMMKGRGMATGGAAPKIEYKKVGTDTVGKWTCDKYEGWQEGKKVSDLCTVAPRALGLTDADFAVARDLADFFKNLTKMLPAGATDMLKIGAPGEQGFQGIPVRSVTQAAGNTITSEMSEISRQSIPDSAFEVPAGFEKRSMPGMGGRGRGGR